MNTRNVVIVAILTFLSASISSAAGLETHDFILKPVPDDPTISYRIWFKVGSQDDPPGKAGLAALTAKLISEGSTKKHRYEDILDLLFPMAGGYESSCTVEQTIIAGRIHKDNAAEFQPLFLDAILEPALLKEDFERIRSDMLSYLENTLRYASDEDLGKAVLYETIFAGTPYGHIAAGHVEGLKSITLDDVRSFYRTNYTHDLVTIGLGGGYDEGTVKTLRNALNKLPPGEGGAAADPPLFKPINGLQVTIVEKDAPATAISIGFPLDVLRGQADWYPLAVANSWFGEHRNSASHLYQVLRELRGLNYGDYSYLEHFRNGGELEFPLPNDARRNQIFEMWIRPMPHAWAHFALRGALRELKLLVDNGLTEEQVAEKRTALGKYVLHFAPTTMDRLGYALDDKFYGIDGSHLDIYRKRMQTITREEVNRAIKKHLQYENLQILIVTKNAKAFRDALLADKPSPISYPSPRPAEVLKEDKQIAAYPLHIKPENIRIISGKDIFEK